MHVSERVAQELADLPPAKAERYGRQAAFDDLTFRGFAHAYNNAESLPRNVGSTYGHFLVNGIHLFAYAYRQVVEGYWMAMDLE